MGCAGGMAHFASPAFALECEGRVKDVSLPLSVRFSVVVAASNKTFRNSKGCGKVQLRCLDASVVDMLVNPLLSLTVSVGQRAFDITTHDLRTLRKGANVSIPCVGDEL